MVIKLIQMGDLIRTFRHLQHEVNFIPVIQQLFKNYSTLVGVGPAASIYNLLRDPKTYTACPMEKFTVHDARGMEVLLHWANMQFGRIAGSRHPDTLEYITILDFKMVMEITPFFKSVFNPCEIRTLEKYVLPV